MQNGPTPNQVRLAPGLLCLIVCTTILGLFTSVLEARIAIYGDTRGGEDVHAQIVEAIASFDPELVFHTGDLSSQGKDPQEFETFHSIIKPLGKAEFYPVRGNHERDEKLYLSYFPQLSGSSRFVLERDSLVFIALDSTHDLKPGSQQLAWLREQLDINNAKPVILLHHHPVFSSGYHGDELSLSIWLPQLLENSSVKAVISGHEHSFEHSLYQGIHYLVSGGGGASLRDAVHPNSHSKVFIKSHHFIILDRVGDDLLVKVFDPDLKLLDSFVIGL